MTTPSFFITPGYGTRLHEALHYSQAMRIGDRVDISGQGGWNDDPVINETMARLYRHYMPDRAPIWTQLGVEALGLPTMRIEIRVTAIIA